MYTALSVVANNPAINLLSTPVFIGNTIGAVAVFVCAGFIIRSIRLTSQVLHTRLSDAYDPEKRINSLRGLIPLVLISLIVPLTAGAAGGVGAGMLAFLNATIVPGIDYLLEMAHFDEIITNAQFIITGEGRIDQQTVMGKAPAGVLRAAKHHDIPVIALCGCLAPDIDPSSLGFASVIEVTPHDMPLEQAMDTATTLSNVERAISSLISNCK